MEPRLQSGLFDELRGRAHDGERPVLTPREHEILELMADGLSGSGRSAASCTSPPRR